MLLNFPREEVLTTSGGIYFFLGRDFYIHQSFLNKKGLSLQRAPKYNREH